MYKSILVIAVLTFAAFGCGECEPMQKLQQEKDQLATELANAQTELASLQSQCKSPGLVHSVFFWLKADLSEADRTAFLAGVASLAEIASVRQMNVGPPAATEERGVVDNTFSTALLVHFDDIAGQDAYQIDPIHLKFVEDHQDKWTKVLVYDSTVTE